MNNNDLSNKNGHVQKKLKLKRKGLIMILFTIMILLLVVVGTSFALWQITIQQTDSNKIQSSCLQLTLTNETSGIELTNAAPISDTEGKSLTPYRFTITNTCDNKTSYTINLENVTIEGEKLLPEQYVKAHLRRKNTTTGETTKTQTESYEEVFLDKLDDKYLNETTVIQKARRSYKLYNSIIEANATENFELRLWMDIDTPTIDAVMDATFQSKITLVAESILDSAQTSKVPVSWQDNGIFKDYYEQAYAKVQTMSIEEKIGQLMVIRHSSSISDAITNYYVGGTTFYATDFSGKTEDQTKEMISNLQSKTKIPLIMAVDEEGGNVVRVSSNSNLAPEPFKASQELYASGGLDLIRSDTVTKSNLLHNLGLNMNFAPVVDIADETAYIYPRTLGQTPEITGQYAVTVIQASQGTGVSYSLKHFPGYGNNADTHGTSSTDETSLEELNNKHLVPFRAGIEGGAESVMIAHNITAALDKENPSSLSKPVHDLLFNDLGFTGIAITDDLDMNATKDIENHYTKAILAGNHIVLCSNYQGFQSEILASIAGGTLTEDHITKLAWRVLAWKYYKGLL